MFLLNLNYGDLSCRIAPEMGGAIYSFDCQANGKTQPLMRPTPSEDAHLITDFSSWPLVPFSNRINKGKFSFGGKNYRVPVTWLGPPHHASHGHGWERPWTVAFSDASRCDLTFAFDDKAIWPFPYKAFQSFKLDQQGLHIHLSLTNTGKEAMPAGIGIHPYFPKTPGTTLQATVGHLWEIDDATIPVRRVPAPAEYDFSSPKSLDQARLDHCFDGYGGLMEIVWPGQPVKLRVTSSNNLKHLVVYTPQGQNFFCAEPVSHMPDAVNRLHDNTIDTGLVIVQPGETLSADYCFEAIKA